MKRYMFALAIISLAVSCAPRKPQNLQPEEFSYNQEGNGPELQVVFSKGKYHNHPLMAIWVEDMNGRFIQTLYVAKSIGKGVFEHGDASKGKWMPGEIRRPAALPVWAHKRGIQAEDGLYIPTVKNPVPDAYTGPTPSRDFVMNLRLDEPVEGPLAVFFEINQTWDWNEYWTNNKYPDDEEYKTSCQPALVYKVTIDPGAAEKEYLFEAVGHSHYSGKDGRIYDSLNTLTTALQIAEEIKITLKQVSK